MDLVGAAGPAIILLCLLALQAILGFFVLSYASRCFFHVIEETAAGNDEVVWTREPITDWFWKLLYLAWLIAVWLVPTYLVLRLFPPLFPDHPALGFMLISVGVTWLMFPIGLLSSLAAGTPWAVLYPPLLGRLARKPLAVIGLYLSSGLLLAGWAGFSYVVMTRGWAFLLIPVAAVASAAVVLIYSRLLGRVARLVSERGADEPEPERGREKPERRTKQRSPGSAEVYDPWEVPKEKPRPRKKKRGAYGVKDYEPPPETPAEAPTGERYELQAPPPAVKLTPPILPEEQPNTEPASRKAGRIRDEELDRRVELPPLPSFPLVIGVYNFPWYRGTVTAWALLALGLLLMGVVLRVQIALWPF